MKRQRVLIVSKSLKRVGLEGLLRSPSVKWFSSEIFMRDAKRPIIAGSPGRLFVILACSIFAGEASVMFLLDALPPLPDLEGALLDSTLLSTIVAPALYFFVFRPLTTHIAEREQAEQALRDSDDAHRHILAASLDGFWLTDVEGRLLEVNATYARQSGYSREELLGMRIGELEINETAAEIAQHIKRILAAGSEQFESIHRRKDGSNWYVEISASYRAARGGQFFVFMRDITERKLAEAAQREYSDLLATLSARMLNAQESEKQRIAVELHEHVAQTLSAAKLAVENTVSAISSGLGSSTQALDALIAPLQAGIRDVRSVAISLRPPTLDDLGLLSTLREICREFGAKHQHVEMETSFNIAEGDLPQPLRAIIFRVVESAFNALAEEEALGRIALSLSSDPRSIVLSLRDDAFELAPPSENDSLGHPYVDARDLTVLSGGKFSVSGDSWGGIALCAIWLR
jgi:PAS domain S-box-containing protein